MWVLSMHHKHIVANLESRVHNLSSLAEPAGQFDRAECLLAECNLSGTVRADQHGDYHFATRPLVYRRL